MSAKTVEQKAVLGLSNTVASVDFDPKFFAFHVGQLSGAVQTQIFRGFLACISLWAAHWDAGTAKDSELSLCRDARRLQDTIDAFGMR